MPAPVLLAAHGKDTSSSSGKVFAKPSKDWVLPERAKPGRKVSSEEPDNHRQSQNRLSQRAHRARRSTYVQTLEDRLRAYEADEIHSNVRLQEVARALKADNERLKLEVEGLKGSVGELMMERSGWEDERRAWDGMVQGLRAEVDSLQGGMSSSAYTNPPLPAHRAERPILHTAEPRSTRPAQVQACPICPDPDPDCPCQQTAPADPTLVPESSCGLCETPDECLCRDLVEDKRFAQIQSPLINTSSDDQCGLCTDGGFCACKEVLSPPTQPAPAISGIALPLRPRNAVGVGVKKAIWRLDIPPAREAVCSGDPDNCDACRNDKFGQEFCQRLSEADASPVKEEQECSTCPGNCMSIPSLLCSSGPSHVPQIQQETMRCDEAWKALKAHPNAQYTSLALLADVVAKRTKCTGPRVELSPPPETRLVDDPPKRRVQVETSSVRNALRLLDTTPAPGAPEGEREGKRRRLD
ncbi:AP-1-like transcription factor, partial [Tremellales sp. Uapishka_1]